MAGPETVAAFWGLDAHDLALWQRALTHRSWVHEHPDEADGDYERLEFLGDALLSAAIAGLLLEERPAAGEGELSFLRSVLVRGEHLSTWLLETPAAESIRLGRGAQQLDEAGLSTIRADVAEALLAVVYLEHGWEALVRVVREGPARTIPDHGTARAIREPKSVLQERLAAMGEAPPRYTPIAQDEQGFQVRVHYAGTHALGAGRNRREAESAAARRALDTLERHTAAGGAEGIA